MRCLLGTLLAITLTGCAATDLKLPWDDSVKHSSKRNPVVKIVTLWQPAEGRNPNNLPCRGFAGQLLFLGNKGGMPVAVDGDVRIYVFDDHGSLEDQAIPQAQVDFLNETWKQQLSVDMLGPSYHVFIPYTRPGVQQATCTLMVRYTPKDGQQVFSEVATVYLKGKRPDGSPIENKDAPQIFHTNSPQDSFPESRSTRIVLPASTGIGQELEAEKQHRIESILKNFAREQSAKQQSLPGDGSFIPTESPRIRWNAKPEEEADAPLLTE